MSNPSFDNLDKWLFEFTEGNLSSYQVSQLKQFMAQNPEIEMDLNAWESAHVDASTVVYPHTDSFVKKPIAWLFPFVILITLGLSFGFGSLVLHQLTGEWTVTSAARVTEMNYVKQLKEESIKSGASTKNALSARSRTETDFFNAYSATAVLPKNSVNQLFKTVLPSTEDFMVRQHARDVLEKVHEKYTNKERIAVINSEEKVETVNNSGSEIKLTKPTVSNTILVSEKNDGKKHAAPSEILKEASMQNAAAMTRLNNRTASNYSKSFGSKIKSTIRKIVRMTDNPIALSNSKDIYYHTPGMQALDVNFASVGGLLKPRFQAVSRAQWTGHGNQQFANQLSYDTYVKAIRGGIGVQVNHLNYGAGALQVGQFALIYSPKLSVSKNVTIEPAIRFKMGNKRLDNQKLTPGQLVEVDRQNDQLFVNESSATSVQNLWYRDIGLALMSNTKWFSVGLQIDNIGQHYNNVFESGNKNDYAGKHITATFGTDYVSRTKLFSFSPYIMYQKVKNLSEIWGGTNFRYKNIIVGGGISSIGDYAGSIGVKSRRFMLMYALDNTYSFVLNQKTLSQQLTLRILTNSGKNRGMLK